MSKAGRSGFGAVNPDSPAGKIVGAQNTLAQPFHLFFGNVEAAVSYAGLAPGAIGSYQFNAIVPNLPTSDAVPVSFTLGGIQLGTSTRCGCGRPSVSARR